MSKETITIDYNGYKLDVDGWYTEATAGHYYTRSGDPGDPPEPASFEIEAIRLNGIDIGGLIDNLYVRHYSDKKANYTSIDETMEALCLEEIDKGNYRGGDYEED